MTAKPYSCFGKAVRVLLKNDKEFWLLVSLEVLSTELLPDETGWIEIDVQKKKKRFRGDD